MRTAVPVPAQSLQGRSSGFFFLRKALTLVQAGLELAYVVQAGPTHNDPPSSVSQVLGLHPCATRPG